MSSAHPGDVVELPPQLAPLQEADTEEQHQLSLEAQQKQVRLAFECSQLLMIVQAQTISMEVFGVLIVPVDFVPAKRRQPELIMPFHVCVHHQ